MSIRNGKFGKFYYCPKGKHGTISVDKYNEILEKTGNVPDEHFSVWDKDPLMRAIENQDMSITGVMTDREKFFIDNELYYENPDDFWQNVRPY